MFQGLAKSSQSHVFLDGNADSSNWLAVGMTTASNGIPAFNGKKAYGVSLYVATSEVMANITPLYVSVTACDGWTSTPASFSMSIMLRGSDNTTPFLTGTYKYIFVIWCVMT